MANQWIRTRDIAQIFSMGRTHSFDIAREFKAQAGERDVINDGRITLFRLSAFEEWLINRGKKLN